MSTPANTVISADAKTVKEWYDRNEIVLVDVRETSEYDQEHIAGSLLLPMSSFDPEIFPEIPSKKVVLHCAIGKRSEAAGKMLLSEGYAGVIHLTGGIDAWKAAGYPTEVQILPPDKKAAEPVYLCPPPGSILAKEYLNPLKISVDQLAGNIQISVNAVDALIKGETPIGVELSLRLARYFSTAPDFWVQLQLDHDMEQARHKMGEEIRLKITPRTAQ
ncbi:MAG: HigA family addiction module antidote protein [Rhodobacteraceae bacterium]|nr:HigA family addiction module antidote protein [Paracoccaceae bacterium]